MTQAFNDKFLFEWIMGTGNTDPNSYVSAILFESPLTKLHIFIDKDVRIHVMEFAQTGIFRIINEHIDKSVPYSTIKESENEKAYILPDLLKRVSTREYYIENIHAALIAELKYRHGVK